MGITIVGLGPGGVRLLTREAWDLLTNAASVYVRTDRHPAVYELPPGIAIRSFDHVYQTAADFTAVYKQIVDELIELGREQEIIYAVPGHPNVGEATVLQLVETAVKSGIPVRVLPGVSFVEPVLTALAVDALDGLQVYDALTIAGYLYPPVNGDAPLLLGQVYNRFIAGEIKQALSAVYPDQHPVKLIHHAGEQDELVEPLALYEIDRSAQIDHLTSLYVPPLKLPSTLPALAETVAVLRSPEGCPWDIEQTPQSMRNGFLEEAFEVLDALDREDAHNLREELGDLLYHIVMQAQMAAEAGEFTLSEVIAGIEAKLKRRHPHVWGDWQVAGTDEVLRNWEMLKKREKPDDDGDSMLDGLLKSLPALALSQKIQHRVGKAGFDWPDLGGIYEKIAEEIGELRQAQTAEEREAELGDLLFVIVNLGRRYDLDVESALRGANARFEQRFRLVESIARQRNLELRQMSLPEMDELWEEAKEFLAKGNEPD